MSFLLLQNSVQVALILSLELCLADSRNPCIVSFSGETVTKHGDCEHPDRDNVFPSIKAMAEEERRLNNVMPAKGSLRTSPPKRISDTQKKTTLSDLNALPAVTSASLLVTSADTKVDLTSPRNSLKTEANALTTTPIIPNLSTLFASISANAGQVRHSSQPARSKWECSLDVMFVLDGSQSVGVNNFTVLKQRIKRFAQEMISAFPTVQIGLLQYSLYIKEKPINEQDYIKTEMVLKNWNYSDFAAAVDKIKYQGYASRHTSAALRKVKYDFMSSKRYNTSGNVQFMILITVGSTVDHETLLQSVDELRNIGVFGFPIGIGSEANTTELRNIASFYTSEGEMILENYYAALQVLHPDWKAPDC